MCESYNKILYASNTQYKYTITAAELSVAVCILTIGYAGLFYFQNSILVKIKT